MAGPADAWRRTAPLTASAAWLAKLDTDPDGAMTIDSRFFPHGDDFRGLRVHQVHLAGGDASSDSYCFA